MHDEQKRYEDKPAPAPVENRFAVRIVSEEGDVALLEWAVGEDTRRAYFPKGKVKPGGMTASELGKAQPYGEDWAEVFPYSFGRELSIALHRMGVWTFTDVAMHRPAVQQKLWAAMGVDRLIRESRRS